MNLGVLVSGRGSNLGAILDASRDGRIESRVVVVLSDVENAPALSLAGAAGVQAQYVDPGPRPARLTPETAGEYIRVLKAHGTEMLLLAGFMRIIGRSFFAAFPPDRILNIHPALLPSFRGLEAQRQALEAGVKVAGCTVHFVSPDVDAGPIIVQRAVRVEPDDTVETLSARILTEEHEAYVEAVRLVETGRVRIDGAVARVLPAPPAVKGRR
jgi:phosphoribosylglycinamide formyltransferase-1